MKKARKKERKKERKKTHPNSQKGDDPQPLIPRPRPPRRAKVCKIGRFERLELLGIVAHDAGIERGKIKVAQLSSAQLSSSGVNAVSWCLMI